MIVLCENLCCINYLSNDNGFIAINKRFLSLEQINFIHESLNKLAQDFIYVHTTLIEHIRYNYREIKW
jgi:hypothetical protein